MIKQEIIDFFQRHADYRGYPNFSNDVWVELKSKYGKDDIRESFARYVHKNNLPYPHKDLRKSDVMKLFHKFYHTSMMPLYKTPKVVLEKYNYKYKYDDGSLGVIDKPHYYNSIANYFQQNNRMKCGSNSQKSPMEIWNDESLLSKMNWHWWREGVMEDDDFDDSALRTGFRLGTYIATQFKPSVAKAIYEKHNSKNIVDTSCGWGDRLAGFYGTPNTELYVGCDPNPEVYEVYKKQCGLYEKVLGDDYKLIEKDNYFEVLGKKTVKIWNKPSEDVDWSLYHDTFDMYFTSPPYFDTEKYAESTDKAEDQSWFRYNSFEKWRDNFLFPVTKDVWKTIKQDGYMMINIYEPRNSSGKINPLCDDMVDEFKTFDDCHYLGKIGMRMNARPHADKKELKGVFVEPIWTFRKSNVDYIKEVTVEDFL